MDIKEDPDGAGLTWREANGTETRQLAVELGDASRDDAEPAAELGHLRLSCDACTAARRRCETVGPPAICIRCSKKGLECVFQLARKSGPRKQGSDAGRALASVKRMNAGSSASSEGMLHPSRRKRKTKKARADTESRSFSSRDSVLAVTPEPRSFECGGDQLSSDSAFAVRKSDHGGDQLNSDSPFPLVQAQLPLALLPMVPGDPTSLNLVMKQYFESLYFAFPNSVRSEVRSLVGPGRVIRHVS
jgi:hypothetical protein